MLWRVAITVVGMFALLACFTTPLHSLDVTLSGVWNKTIDGADLISGAGSNLISTYESASDQVQMDISDSLGAGHSWRVDVSKTDISWNPDIEIHVRRTSDGIGGSVSGGTSYLEISNLDQQFFTGTADVMSIDLQYKLDNISVSIPAGNYNTLIVYTVLDL